jgi:hypothetical protein
VRFRSSDKDALLPRSGINYFFGIGATTAWMGTAVVKGTTTAYPVGTGK